MKIFREGTFEKSHTLKEMNKDISITTSGYDLEEIESLAQKLHMKLCKKKPIFQEFLETLETLLNSSLL